MGCRRLVIGRPSSAAWIALWVLALIVGASRAEAYPAFPGAEGFGANTPGGRGGPVLAVTNLTDTASPFGYCDGTGATPGSLRWALYNTTPQYPDPGHRTVIFRVAGTITLQNTLCIPPYTTIAGQTAPGGGIAIRLSGGVTGPAIQIGGTISPSNDVVLRYIRVRAGANSPGSYSSARDAISITQSTTNVILDHVSASWGVDSDIDSSSTKNVTIQWSILSEALDCSSHDKTGIQCSYYRPQHRGHSTGSLFDDLNPTAGTGLSLHHNLYAHDRFRLPRISTAGVIDMVNNLIYTPYAGNTEVSDGYGQVHSNIVENFYSKSDLIPPSLFYEIFPIPEEQDLSGNPISPEDHFEVYLSGNLGWRRPDNSYPEDVIVDPFYLDPANSPWCAPSGCTFETPTPHAAPMVTTETATDASSAVLADAGATLPARDEIDLRIVDEVATGGGKIVDNPCDVVPGSSYRSCMDACTADSDACQQGCQGDLQCRLGCNSTQESCMLACGSDQTCLDDCGPDLKCLAEICNNDPTNISCINTCLADPLCYEGCPKEHYCAIGCCTADPWPDLTEGGTAQPPLDSDGDLLPDAWETSHGLDPNTMTDPNIDAEGDGYTLIEEYLNGTDPAVIDGVPSPIDVAAVASARSATVSWTPRQPGGGEPLTEFTVTASPGGQTATAAGGATSAVVTDLADGTTYTFTVVASTATASSPASQPSSPITTPTLPTAPLNAAAVAGVGSADVTWDPPADDGGTAITSYRVEVARNIETLTGDGTCPADPGQFGDGGPASAGRVCDPIGLTANAAGDLFIADFDDLRVRRVDAASGVITTVAGGGTDTGENVPAVDAQILNPSFVAIGSGGDLYISVFNEGRIRKVDTLGMISTVATGFNGPAGLAFDAAGNLYVADYSDQVVKRITPGGMITVVAGTGTCDFSEPVDEVDAVSSQLCLPLGLAIDGAGNLYIADSQHNRIRMVDGAGIIHTVFGTGETSSPLDPLDLGDGGPALQAYLQEPWDVWTDGAGTFYIADKGHNRVRQVVPDGTIRTVAGDGSGVTSGDGGSAILAGVPYPSGLAVDPGGRLHVSQASFGGNQEQYVRRIGPAGPEAIVPGTETAATVPGLDAGASYGFLVVASNAVGQGPYSQPSNTVTVPTVPDPPTDVAAVAANKAADVSWTAPQNDGGDAITQYIVTSSPDGVTATAGGGESSVRVENLMNGTEYTFTVEAINGVGTSGPSQPSNVVKPPNKTYP